MNKTIKRVIAVALAVNALSVIEPINNFNITNTIIANAEVKGADLKKISLGYGSIDFKRSKTEYTVNLDSDIDELKVSAEPREDDAQIEINGTDVSNSDNRKMVKLDKGENKILIKVQNGSRKKTYTLTVNRGHAEENQIYLSNIILNQGEINFSKDTTSYDVKLKSDVNELSIKAVPEDTDYDVEIDGITAYEDNNFKRTVSLKSGDSSINVKIQDDDDHEKTYTLNIKREAVSTSANTSSNSASSVKQENNTSADTNKANITTSNIVINKGWVLNNGQWCYVEEDGNRSIGWKSLNNIWYYFDQSGQMKTGWQQLKGQWYYLDDNGQMKTGWLKNYDGKWYYFYSSGVMAKSVTIDGSKLDKNGAWVK